MIQDINYNNIKIYLFYRYCLAVGNEKIPLAVGYALQYLQTSDLGEQGSYFLRNKMFHEHRIKPSMLQMIHFYLHPYVNLTPNHIAELINKTPMTVHHYKKQETTPYLFDYKQENTQGIEELSEALTNMDQKLKAHPYKFYSGFIPVARKQGY